MLASFSGLPPGLGPRRFPRRRSDRGRYPEEVGDDDDVFQREDSPESDDEAEMDSASVNGGGNNSSNGGAGDAAAAASAKMFAYAYKAPNGGSEPVPIAKPCTPAGSIRGTPEDSSGFRAISESPGGMNMDVDFVSSPLFASYYV